MAYKTIYKSVANLQELRSSQDRLDYLSIFGEDDPWRNPRLTSCCIVDEGQSPQECVEMILLKKTLHLLEEKFLLPVITACLYVFLYFPGFCLFLPIFV